MSRGCSALLVLIVLFVGARKGHGDAPRLGVMVDAGVPDGVSASLVVSLMERARFHAGVSKNYISTGVRSGGTIRLLRGWISPALSLEVGSYAAGDAHQVMALFSGDTEVHLPTLDRIGYGYANFHLGIEARRSRTTVYLHAGLSKVSAQLHDLQETIEQQMPHEPGQAHPELGPDVRIDALIPSARLGFLFHF